MLNRSIIATQVTNLTDARYFAARGIEYLLFDMDESSIDTILEIKEWVEGPKILLLCSDDSLALIDEGIIKIQPFGLSAKTPSTSAKIQHLSAHVVIFTWNEKEIIIEDLNHYSVKNIENLETIDKDAGLIISGGAEDAVGIKAFDDLDELLDSLEDLE